jgi:hypothetical protein
MEVSVQIHVEAVFIPREETVGAHWKEGRSACGVVVTE